MEGGRLRPDAQRQVQFVQANLLGEGAVPEGRWEILIANPPYISPKSFDRETSLSVRRYEPRMALVPAENYIAPGGFGDVVVGDQAIGDVFYPRLLDISSQTRAKLVILEVADIAQAKRIACLALNRNIRAQCELWRDWPGQASTTQEIIQLQGKSVRVVGQGHGRAVVIMTNLPE